jgi:hypothetical protein
MHESTTPNVWMGLTPGAKFKKRFSSQLMIGPNKLECFYLAGLSCLVQCLLIKPAAYPREDHLYGLLGQALELIWPIHKI